MGFTFIFGLYSSYLLVKTQTLYSCILLHSYCNWMGFPRIGEAFENNKILTIYIIGISSFFVLIFV